MKKIKLKESDLLKIVQTVLNEQSVIGAPNYGTTSNDRGISGMARAAKKPNINPKGLKKGAGGKFSPNLTQDVIALQQKLIDLGLLKTKSGKPTGYFGDLTQIALDKYNSGAGAVNISKKAAATAAATAKTTGKALEKTVQKIAEKGINPANYPGCSKQVIKQLDYLSKNGLMGDEKFTIVDDNRSTVHAFEPGYKLVKTMYVITGNQSKGDKIIGTDYWSNLWDSFTNDAKALFGYDQNKLQPTFSKAFLGNRNPTTEYSQTQSTPAGLFRRVGGIVDSTVDKLAAWSDRTYYGKKYISFETLDGKDLSTAFHGTNLEKRKNILNAKDVKNFNPANRKLSKGCINFKEDDIIWLDGWMDTHDRSIWLPSDGKSIVSIGPGEGQIPEDLHDPSWQQRAKNIISRIV